MSLLKGKKQKNLHFFFVIIFYKTFFYLHFSLFYFFIFYFAKWLGCYPYTMRKKGLLQLVLRVNFWVAMNTCNSSYLYVVNPNKQITWIAKLQFNVYMVQFITTQLQLYQNNSFSTTMRFHYNYTHDVMLMLLIVIHLLKINTWHYGSFWTYKLLFFQNIDLHC
jgi:hypothetical protein